VETGKRRKTEKEQRKKEKRKKRRKEERKKGRKEERKKGEKRWYQTAELDRRDQVTATNSCSVPSKGEQRSITRWQHLLNQVHPQLAPSENRSPKSADGRWRQRRLGSMEQFGKEETRKKKENEDRLDTDGLLMEGVDRLLGTHRTSTRCVTLAVTSRPS